MPNLEETLTILKKKKLTAKTIVEQQRNEIRLLQSTMTVNERLEEIYRRFDTKSGLNTDLYDRILHKSNDTVPVNDQIEQTVNDLSKLIEQILRVLSLPNDVDLNDRDLHTVVKRQKECFQLIKWKLSDAYADRLADEIDMNANKSNRLSFEDFRLPSGLLLGLHAMGFQHGPSDIQGLILPYSLSEQAARNIIVQSKTGTGKTISYIIHALARVQPSLSQPQILIIVPTVELAYTVGSGIEKVSVNLPNVPITYVTSFAATQDLIRTPIMIGTIDVFEAFQSLLDLSQLNALIIDEIDTMVIREDYRQNVLALIDCLPLIDPPQMLVYSSTLSEQIMNFTSELIPNAIVIRQRSDRQQLCNVQQFYMICDDERKKMDSVKAIVNQFPHTQMMIFCADDGTTDRLYDAIVTDKKNDARMLTTGSTDHQRISLIEDFRSNSYRIFLLSAQTSATTHGIDLDNVRIVINYDLPYSLGHNADLDYVTYHQRLDRCGRYDQHGYLFNLIQSSDDWNIQLGQQDYFSFAIHSIDIDGIRALVL